MKVATFPNNKKKDLFSNGIRLVFLHGKVFKEGSRGTLPHLRWSFSLQFIMAKSCKGLHLICNKVQGFAPDFYVPHYYMW